MIDFKRHEIGNEVYQLFRAVLELRRQVASLEKAEGGKLYGTRPGLNYLPSRRTNEMDAAREKYD
jgi:hypothetical protein